MNLTVHTILDNVTDVAAIVALTYISVQRGNIPIEIISAITSIALGARYVKNKANMYSTEQTASSGAETAAAAGENTPDDASTDQSDGTRDAFQ